MDNDIIAAIATSLGEAGIGIVRLSGKGCIQLADKVFQPVKGNNLAHTKGFRLRYGKIMDNESIIDEVIVVVMREPNSFTGENIIEFQCHGGIVVTQKILGLVLSHGARLAEPGEFTKRAFLNGRLDLSQAEAVIDVIRSKTELSLDVAMQQLEGGLSNRIQELRSKLYNIIVRVEASIDFPEDDIPEVEYSEMANILREISEDIKNLIVTANTGKVFREGIKTVITGKPNVGKSSLLNRLLNENRALVTHIPGTTRDVIEELLNLKGYPIRLLDTAGIRKSEDLVEKMGVERSLELIKQADLVLHVLDISSPISNEDKELLDSTENKPRVIVLNKLDLGKKWSQLDLSLRKEAPIVEISLLEDSLDPLIETIIGLIQQGFVQKQNEGAVITRSRHKHSLENAYDDIQQAIATLEKSLPIDLIAVGLQGALEHLGEITGETVRDNMVEQIFAEFCIGK